MATRSAASSCGQGVTDGVDDRVVQWLTAGARLHLTLPMTLELGMQLGLQSAGYAVGPKLMQLSGYGSLSWSWSFKAAIPEPVAAGKNAALTASQVAASPPHAGGSHGQGLGSIAGAVRDARTGVALPDAVVRRSGPPQRALGR